MTTLENVLRNRSGIVFEHEYEDKSISQLVYLNGKIYHKVKNSDVCGKWMALTIDEHLSALFFKRADPQPTDLPKSKDGDNMSTLENVLRNRPGIVFEHEYEDKSITQLVYLNGKIYHKAKNSDGYGRWMTLTLAIDEHLSALFFKRADPQPTDLPKIEDECLSGQALIDTLKANPNVEYRCLGSQISVKFDTKDFVLRTCHFGSWRKIDATFILAWVSNRKFVRVDQPKQEELVDPIKLLYDNPDVVFCTNAGHKYRCHDFTIQYLSSLQNWINTDRSIDDLRVFIKELRGLTRYDPQEDLKKKLEAVKLPKGVTLLDCDLNTLRVKYKDRVFMNHISSITDLTNAIQSLREDLATTETRIKLLNIMIEHEEQNKQEDLRTKHEAVKLPNERQDLNNNNRTPQTSYQRFHFNLSESLQQQLSYFEQCCVEHEKQNKQ